MIVKETLKNVMCTGTLSEKLLAEECLRLIVELEKTSAPGQRQEGGFQPDLSLKRKVSELNTELLGNMTAKEIREEALKLYDGEQSKLGKTLILLSHLAIILERKYET